MGGMTAVRHRRPLHAGWLLTDQVPGTTSYCCRAASEADKTDSSLGTARMPSKTQGRLPFLAAVPPLAHRPNFKNIPINTILVKFFLSELLVFGEQKSE